MNPNAQIMNLGARGPVVSRGGNWTKGVWENIKCCFPVAVTCLLTTNKMLRLQSFRNLTNEKVRE